MMVRFYFRSPGRYISLGCAPLNLAFFSTRDYSVFFQNIPCRMQADRIEAVANKSDSADAASIQQCEEGTLKIAIARKFYIT